MVKGLLALALLLITACSFQEGPSLVKPDEPTVVVVVPTSTPTPEDLMSGKWFSIISETVSHEAGSLKIDVKQLRFSTPERLLPDLTEAELVNYGIAGAPSLIAVRINVENMGTDMVEFNPSGFGNVLTVGGVETRPIFALTGETANLAAGEKEGFMMVFPVTYELNDVQEVMYTVRGNSYTFSDIDAKGSF
ncbi:MAG: hypothetical protein O2821_07775 [Chloroflexi bacterium]|nr:hypothetical protein [Chloroflexota bacterium]MDA1227710.1 hypothetical protein [Chloroflexota bacterium]